MHSSSIIVRHNLTFSQRKLQKSAEWWIPGQEQGSLLHKCRYSNRKMCLQPWTLTSWPHSDRITACPWQTYNARGPWTRGPQRIALIFSGPKKWPVQGFPW